MYRHRARAGELIRSALQERVGERMAPRTEDVRRELARLRAADPSLEQFGARAHGYRLNPPLAEAEAVAVEEKLGITLPAEYREFVTQVGDGGAGPGHGVYALRDVLAMGRKRWRRATKFADPAQPFARPWTVTEAERFGGFPTHGLIALCETGCGGGYGLVVTGTERGRVWAHNTAGFYAPACTRDPVYPAGATVADRLRINEQFHAALLAPTNRVRLGFWDWYRWWLEGAG